MTFIPALLLLASQAFLSAVHKMEQNILVDVVLYGLIVHSVEITTGKYSL